MARYRKIDVRIWGDRKVRALTPIPPCGQGLWFYLLTGRETGIIPGLVVGGEATLAESLRWPLEAFRKAFAEVLVQGMAKADWEARVVWVPNAAAYNKPESPNVIRSWSDAWDETPECALKVEAWRGLRGFAKGWGEPFVKAFAEACPEPFAKAMANQEQEQEQEQEHPRDEGCGIRSTGASVPSGRRMRLGLTTPEGEAFAHWQNVAWPKVSSAPHPDPEREHVEKLRAACAQSGMAAVKAAMDRAVVDPWWREKLDLGAFLNNLPKFLPRNQPASAPVKVLS